MTNARQQYRLDKFHRDDVLRAARQQQLIRAATSTRRKTYPVNFATLYASLLSLFR
jgi:hypothetical protein